MAAGGVKFNWNGSGNASFLDITLAGGDIPTFGSEDFTATWWANITSSGDGTEGHYMFILLDSDSSGEYIQTIATNSPTDPSNIRTQVVDFGTNPVARNETMPAGQNWFFAVTWNHTTGVLTGYSCVDGGTTASSDTGVITWSRNPEILRIGAKSTSTLPGGIFTVRNYKVWNVLLNSASIETERHSEAPVTTSGLVADYRLTSTSDYGNTYAGAGAWGSLSATIQGTGTITTGSMDPADIRTATSSGCLWYGILKA